MGDAGNFVLKVERDGADNFVRKAVMRGDDHVGVRDDDEFVGLAGKNDAYSCFAG